MLAGVGDNCRACGVAGEMVRVVLFGVALVVVLLMVVLLWRGENGGCDGVVGYCNGCLVLCDVVVMMVLVLFGMVL